MKETEISLLKELLSVKDKRIIALQTIIQKQEELIKIYRDIIDIKSGRKK